jgi:hypothetical protein
MDMNSGSPTIEFDQHYAAEQLRRARHPLRRFVKGFYLRNILKDVRGPAIDFGCGAGQLLAVLPSNSVGLEVNGYLIDALNATGLRVRQAEGSMEDFKLTGFTPGVFRTLVIAHVLEHLSNPEQALHLLLDASVRLGIDRVVVVVPGPKGYASDRTHKTFIDKTFFETRFLDNQSGFVKSSVSYFPGPWEWVGRYFVFHEMKIVFDRERRPE